MFAHLAGSRGLCWGRSWWLLAILFLLSSPPARAQPPRPSPPSTAISAAPQAVTALSWKDIYNPTEGYIGNRRRMLQTLIVLMCVALWIIWWRKLS